ncbi:MAG: hypothetical protein ACXQTL_03845 [Methanosarcinales archaeon]
MVDTLTQRTEQMELDIIKLEQGLMEVYKDNKVKGLRGIIDLAAKDSAAQLTADIEQDFPYESDNIDNSHNRDLDTDI